MMQFFSALLVQIHFPHLVAVEIGHGGAARNLHIVEGKFRAEPVKIWLREIVRNDDAAAVVDFFS